jgi:hypothetical protein
MVATDTQLLKGSGATEIMPTLLPGRPASFWWYQFAMMPPNKPFDPNETQVIPRLADIPEGGTNIPKVPYPGKPGPGTTPSTGPGGFPSPSYGPFDTPEYGPFPKPTDMPNPSGPGKPWQYPLPKGVWPPKGGGGDPLPYIGALFWWLEVLAPPPVDPDPHYHFPGGYHNPYDPYDPTDPNKPHKPKPPPPTHYGGVPKWFFDLLWGPPK